MKKVLALVLGLILALGMAFAEAEAPAQEAAAWKIVVDHVEISKDGETVVLDPALVGWIGRDENGIWGQAAVAKDDVNLAAVQAEIQGDNLLVSADGAQDALLIPGIDVFLEQFGLNSEMVNQVIDMLFAGLAADPAEIAVALAQQGISIVQDGERGLILEGSAEGIGVKLRLSWEAFDGERPYDLTAKNICRYTYREANIGDGTDIPAALSAAVVNLMGDVSVQRLISMFDLGSLEM